MRGRPAQTAASTHTERAGATPLPGLMGEPGNAARAGEAVASARVPKAASIASPPSASAAPVDSTLLGEEGLPGEAERRRDGEAGGETGGERLRRCLWTCNATSTWAAKEAGISKCAQNSR